MFRAKHVFLLVFAPLLLFPLRLFSQGLPLNSTKLIIESGIPVKLQLAQTISSGHAQKSDRVEFIVDKDVEIGRHHSNQRWG
jgi:hypothetical protein